MDRQHGQSDMLKRIVAFLDLANEHEMDLGSVRYEDMKEQLGLAVSVRERLLGKSSCNLSVA